VKKPDAISGSKTRGRKRRVGVVWGSYVRGVRRHEAVGGKTWGVLAGVAVEDESIAGIVTDLFGGYPVS
jgi:hypothetical protein